MRRTLFLTAFTALLLVLMVCAGCGAPSNVVVHITGKGFNPAKVTVKVGGTVTWVNDDKTQGHTVTEVQEAFDSNAIDPGHTFTHRFDHAGTVDYYCRFHPNEKGEVVVR